MVKVHIKNTKHITIANIYIPPRDSTSTHYKTADTDIQHCVQYITNIPHSVLTGDVNAHSTLWHSYTDDHRGKLIADVISNSDHIPLNTNTNTQTRVPNTTLQQISSPDFPTVQAHCTIGHRGQLNTHYHQTTYPSSQQLTYDMTTDYKKNDGHSPTTRKLTGHNSLKTQSLLSLRPPYICIIKENKISTIVVVVYRPPPSCKNGLRYEDVAVEWASYIEQFVEVQEELLVVGDFNIHVDSSNNESQSFLDILNANGLIQHVKSSTHQKGHILDLVITGEHSNLLKRPPAVFISGVSDVKSSSSLDHFAVLCYLNVNRSKTIHKSAKFRAFRNIPVPDYRNDVKLLMCNRRKPQKNIDDLINNYNSTLQKLTDKYAPLQCKTIPLRPHAPWYTSALRQEKRVRRRGERVAARTMLEVDRQIVQDMYRRRNEQL